eukprot:1335915-Amorphochlora_amoeboformis.AAC.1
MESVSILLTGLPPVKFVFTMLSGTKDKISLRGETSSHSELKGLEMFYFRDIWGVDGVPGERCHIDF